MKYETKSIIPAIKADLCFLTAAQMIKPNSRMEMKNNIGIYL